MNIVLIIATIGFFLYSFRNILFWTALWQVKEYRLDRFLVHIKETDQGKKLFISWESLLLFILILLYGLVVFYDVLTFWYQLLVAAFFLGEGIKTLWQIKTHTIKRPVPTAKSLAIVLLTLFVVSFFYAFPFLDMFPWLLVVKFVISIFVSIFVFFFSIPTELFIDIQMQRAFRKRIGFPNLISIAVSGSYGKTSTKEYLGQMLSKKYNVVMTPLSNNTPIGIARTILSKVNSNTDIFIAEVGSYKMGEVAELAAMIIPRISITTSVSDQHLSLYGSIQNVILAEKELIDSLPKKSLALFNGNSNYALELSEKTKKKKLIFTTKEGLKSADIKAINIVVDKNFVKFDVIIGRKKLKNLRVPLLGAQVIENILPGIYLSFELGLNEKEIREALEHLMPPPKTMRQYTLTKQIIAIDDTFNASPESVIAAANYLKAYEKKKIVVLSPLIELGKNARLRHVEIGRKLAFCDFIYVTNSNFLKEIQEGVEMDKGKCLVMSGEVKEIAKEIVRVARRGDVILFEGKEAGGVLKHLL